MLYLGEKEIFLKKSNGSGDGEGGSSSVDAVIDVTKLYTPKEYEIYFIVGDVPYKLDYRVQDIDKCFLKEDDSHDSNYVVLDGRLYYITDARKGMAGLTQVGTSDKWTAITGTSNGGTYRDGNYTAHGICDGALYALSGTTVTLVDNSLNWTHLAGYAYIVYFSSSRSSVVRATGIADGDVYYITLGTNLKTSITKKITGDFTFISGAVNVPISSGSVKRYTLAYNGSTLYSVEVSSKIKVKDITGLKKITHGGVSSWSSSPNVYTCFGLDNGNMLYTITRDGGASLTSKFKTPCQDVSGHNHSSGYDGVYNEWALIINDHKLYYLQDSGIYQIGSDIGWSNVYGYMTSSRRAFGICNNKLYSIVKKSTVKDLGLRNPVKVFANNSGAANPSLVICRT